MVLIISSRVAQFILLFLTIKISTSLLLPSEMAKVYIINSLFSFFALIFINPVGMYINRRLHSWNSSGKISIYFNYFWCYLVIICLFGYLLLELLFRLKLFQLNTELKYISMLVFSTLFFVTINQTVIPSLNLLGFRKCFVVLALATTASSLAFATLLVYFLKPIAEYWLSGILIGYILLTFMGWRFFYCRINSGVISNNVGIPKLVSIVKFSIPISISVGLGWFQSQSYRFMMESSLGMHELGLFAAGYGISLGIISAFESIFTTYLQPKFYKNISTGGLVEQANAWRDYAGSIFPSMILVGFVIIATASDVTRVILGREYWSASQFVIWGVVAELARVASGVYGMVAHARMKTKLLIVPSLVGALTSVGLIWWLIPIYKSNGVGIALMSSSLIILILTYYFTRKEYVLFLPYGILLRSIFMGISIIILAELLRLIFGHNITYINSAVNLYIVGCIFIFFQYLLLRPLFLSKSIYA